MGVVLLKILLLSPHTDDVELGAGATLNKLLKKNEIMWIVFSIARESVPKNLNENVLKNEFISVANMIDINNYKIFDFPVRNFPLFRQDILEELIKLRDTFNPELVIGPSKNDIHQDHATIYNEMIRAFKLSSIISYELPWNQNKFEIQLISKVTKAQMEMKMEMINCYKSQKQKNRPYFDRNFIFSMAKLRGLQSNSEYAEAFEVFRWYI